MSKLFDLHLIKIYSFHYLTPIKIPPSITFASLIFAHLKNPVIGPPFCAPNNIYTPLLSAQYSISLQCD